MKKIMFLFLFCLCGVQATNQKHQRVLDHLFANSTKHIFNVDDERFLLKMAYENNQLMYRAVYPFANIQQSGAYKLATKVTGTITIYADNVTLDLNGNTVAGGIVVNAGLSNITITNGTIDSTGSVGINFGAACTNCTVSGLVVKNGATDGISCNTLSDSVITDCTFTNNMTGLALNNCCNITVNNCTANCNTDIGFEMVSSLTCSLISCQALATGQGNTDVQGAFVAGFSSSDGSANIFQRCIANSTQALSSTGFNSTVAGFALLGTESNSQIIACTASNATTSQAGVTVPYGVLLEATVNNPITLTGTPVIPAQNNRILSVDWSPDVKFLAAGGSESPFVQIFEYNRLTQRIIRVAIPTQLLSEAFVVRWDPSGNYIAAGDTSTDQTFIYEFDQDQFTLNKIAEANTGNSVLGLDWHPSGQFVAIGDITNSPFINVFQFNRITYDFSLVAQPISPSGGVRAVQFSPDGNYLAVGSTTLPFLRVYEFNQTSLNGPIVPSALAGICRAVAWSPDGKYLAVGVFASPFLQIYEFDGTALVLLANGSPVPAAEVRSIDWSNDGKTIVIGLEASPFIQLYNFNPGVPSLTAGSTPDNIPGGIGYSVSWSIDGGVIAGGFESGDLYLRVYEALTFPSNNVIINNTVYCNSGGSIPSGIGIAGSSVANVILGNTSFDNPLLRQGSGGQAPIVFSNYAFVTNIFDQNFGNAPTALQNLAFSSTNPIQTPDDINVRLLRSLSKACDIQTKVDYLVSVYG